MKNRRDDFGWLVTILEEKKRYQNVRLGRKYTAKEQTSPEFQQWKRKMERRRRMTLIFYVAVFIVGAVVPLILH